MQNAFKWVLSAALILLGGCTDSAAENPVANSPCQAAADHLAACVGQDPAPETANCDPAETERIAQLPCDQLVGGLEDAKADRLGIRATACRWGVFRYCTAPTCDPIGDEPAAVLTSMPEGSACLDSVRDLEGCGVCEYYACQEARWQCGDTGYLLGFAQKYCLRYRLVAQPRMSVAAQAWLNRVRRCLVVGLEAFEGENCEALETFGIESHPTCYVSTGFCELKVRDWLGVLATIDPRDLTAREVLVTGVSCLKQWFGR